MGILVLIVFWGISFAILGHKDREWYYYLLAFLMPLPGLIVALCLKNRKHMEDKSSQPPSFDITNTDKK